MRLAALVVFCALIVVISALRFEPMKPDARLPTFAEMNDPNRPHPAMKPDARLPTFAEMNDPNRAHRAVSAPESADRKQIWQAMLNAANRLENSPCDKSLRQPLRTAISAYIKARRENDPSAPDEDTEIVREAAEAGILRPEDILTSTGAAVFSAARAMGMANTQAQHSDHSNYGGRFACKNG